MVHVVICSLSSSQTDCLKAKKAEALRKTPVTHLSFETIWDDFVCVGKKNPLELICSFEISSSRVQPFHQSLAFKLTYQIFVVRRVHFNSNPFDLRSYEDIVLYLVLNSLNGRIKKSWWLNLSSPSVPEWNVIFVPALPWGPSRYHGTMLVHGDCLYGVDSCWDLYFRRWQRILKCHVFYPLGHTD